MIERSQHFRLALEASHAVRIAEERRRQDFQRHIALERRVASTIHLAHAALAEQREHFVMSEFVA